MKHSYLSLIGWISLTLAAGVFSGAVNQPDAWYYALNKPEWNPPNWVFGPVWIILYILMGVAVWLVWKKRSGDSAFIAIVVYIVQLILNAAWTWIFFGLHSPVMAFVEICLLWMAILATSFFFRRVYPLAAGLLLPYLLWVTFAAALNFTIWRLNIGIN